MAADSVTPEIDNTPYIQYALEVLTRERQKRPWLQSPPGLSEAQLGEIRQSHRVSKEDVAWANANPSHEDYDGKPISGSGSEDLIPAPEPSAPISAMEEPLIPRTAAAAVVVADRNPRSEQWIPVDKDTLQTIDPRGRTYPPLTFKPPILRPFSMLLVILICLLAMAALIYCNISSNQHAGLTPYAGTIYSGQYLVFRILPQLVAAFIMMYSQSILAASLRILPFATMATEDPGQRYLALFQSMYPKSFLLPQLVGPWQIRLFGLATWLANFTVPLASAAFTCIFEVGRWKWATSQGVVWTLVGLYAVLASSAAVLMAFWFGHWTGLSWDVRSVGDLVPLLNRSNTMHSYSGWHSLEPDQDFKAELRDRWFDRLGYWRTEDMLTGGIWHTIGTSAMPTPFDLGPEMKEAKASAKTRAYRPITMTGLDDGARLGSRSGGYLPWCLRDGPMIASVALTGSLLVALLLVSFLPQTRLDYGFAPQLSAKPKQDGFSAANFVYSFVPATLGIILFSLFQTVDQSLRMVQPWAELKKANGATARRSILADYTACLPLQVTWRALANRHWRLALTSFMSTLFIFIPILGGGLFMALVTSERRVRMFPSMPVYGVLLSLLVLYAVCLAALVPQRRAFELPHAVSSVGAVISLCSADELTQDAAFRAVRSRRDLEARLGADKDDAREESIWYLGILPGRDEQRLSVRRMKRYTERAGRYACAV